MMYAISIPKMNGNYLSWCDDHWYGTAREKLFRFCKEEIDTIVGQMLNHYVYCLEIEGEDGSKSVRQYKSKFQREMEARLGTTVIETHSQKEETSEPVKNKFVWKIRK